ncbi:response regulator transcription factor [Cellulomonas sp. RIT-PI-Y]|uniref:response regulator transcription factor n=1 Tax=Cellulomonas sp. RIT-PI-Y TaxID=3035297 RepID=UPI0021DA82E9|nr:response regulator transcription factor [Cellulomonas sp. RIT-PI-Y]
MTGPQRAVRVSIVEDETLLLGMLEQTFRNTPGVRVVHALPGVTEARLAITRGSTDVALLDINLADGNGIALGLQLERIDPDIRIVLLSSHDMMGVFTTVQDEVKHAWSYLSKRSAFARDVLVQAVIATSQGRVVLDPQLVQRSVPRAGTDVADLTAGQLQVLRLVAEGLSNQAVADRLNISPRSVESHLLAIYRRLEIEGGDANRRVAAVLRFLRETGRSWAP